MTETNAHQSRRRSSVTVLRSEYSDATLRTNSQAENRLVLTVKKYDRAREATFNDIEFQKKQIQKSLRAGRRQSCPALRLRGYQDRLEEERAQWNRKYRDFLAETESFKSDLSPSSSRTLEWPHVDEGTEGVPANSADDGHVMETYENAELPQQNSEAAARPNKPDIWSTLSAPKHPIPPIRALRAKYSNNVDHGKSRGCVRTPRAGPAMTSTPRALDIPRINLSHSAENLHQPDHGEECSKEGIDMKPCGGQGVIATRSPRLPPSPRLKRLSRIDLSLDVSSQFTPRSRGSSPMRPT